MMVIVSAGMQKSGSGYLYNLINELLIEAGHADARQIKDKRKLDSMMRWHNNNIGKLTVLKLLRLWAISVADGNFVVKTHWGPYRSTLALNRVGLIKVIYCYRDPRDVLLSAIDHGEKILAAGNTHAFAKMVDFDKALVHIQKWLDVWQQYSRMSGVLMIRYEDMMEDPFPISKRIAAFLNIAIDDPTLEKIIWNFSRDNPDGDRRGMHFNKANTCRYRSEMTAEQLVKCQETFGNHLKVMGYALE